MNTLSVVVPAFNESAYLDECLDALLEQREYIHEIIVVDNNSTDDTAAIVLDRRRAFPMITLVAESERGVVHARNTGFDHAGGSIIGRIDVDTHVGPGWAESILDFFDRRPDYAAVTGPIYLYGSPWAAPYGAFVNYTTKRKPDELRVSAASGNNFAIRRSAWQAARHLVSLRTDLHEDIDLSLCLYRVGLHIALIKTMCVQVSGRRLLTPPLEYRHYLASSYRTWAYHGLASTAMRRRLVKNMVLHTVHWPLTRMLSTCESRILPVSHSDSSVTSERRLSSIHDNEYESAASGQ